MRKEFSAAIEKIARKDKKIIFLTGDLGFNALENIQAAIGKRFINIGVSEQNMITMAAALAAQGFIPICYSIAPFTVFRPAEQIRLDICLHNLNVKIVGNGGGYGYGIMGGTHHAIEDLAFLSSLQNMRCFIPFCDQDVEEVIGSMMACDGPAYLRLGKGEKPKRIKLPKYSPVRKILTGNKLTVVSIGPVGLNVLQAEEKIAGNPVDFFVVSELSIKKLLPTLKSSVIRTKKLLVVEEHVARGGLGEHLTHKLSEAGLYFKFFHLCAQGYPSGCYGSQNFHQTESHLDSKSIEKIIRRVIK